MQGRKTPKQPKAETFHLKREAIYVRTRFLLCLAMVNAAIRWTSTCDAPGERSVPMEETPVRQR